MEERRVRANGFEFAYLEEGDGPTVFLLHGFPDNAHSWSHQTKALSAAGYRVIAPFLRGYPPSQTPENAYYDSATLALDVKELIVALGGGEPVYLVGQDWGAGITYNVVAAFPELVRRAVAMAIPHAAQIRRTLLSSPKHLHHSFHWWFFQLPDMPEAAIAANDYAFIDYLWNDWSPGHEDAAHIATIKQMLAKPGALAATLGYYRAMLSPARADPALKALDEACNRPISVPMLALCGSNDMRWEMLEPQKEFFTGPYEWKVLEGCGHFLHRERPADVTELILDWLRRPA
ncbi:alpha/beta fold hydrolase [Phenylobacterium sp.]|uniref:alpha/beta fold hydrolase n=1 Tax=Phenylobacterium sp. TaxID=1871053 RepID=UPI002732BB3D|nr:alpha/beta hydrolase [Phenylobacterium sp.]MDP3854084.1 alpha/beta hydrolase [Phenylobacterium sp.]